MPIDPEERELIELRGWKRAVVVAVGISLIAVPLFVYLDNRIGLLGEPIQPGGLDLMLAVFAVIGALLLVSGITGVLFTWQGVSPVSGRADRNRIDATKPEKPQAAAMADADRKPPFKGDFTKWTLHGADSDFVDAASDYFEARWGGQQPFAAAVKQVYRSAAGRPSWYFEVENPDGELQWIRVPHRGKAGRGAGTAVS